MHTFSCEYHKANKKEIARKKLKLFWPLIWTLSPRLFSLNLFITAIAKITKVDFQR